MTEYVIKSTISLTILYSLYFLFLRNIKTFEFNRFYLLFAIIFSFTIPFIQFTTDINLTISQNISDYSSSIKSINTQGLIESEQTNNIINLTKFLWFVYILISSILLIRFVYNLYKIIKTIKNSKIVKDTFPKIVLSTNTTLPYSFLYYIIVNKSEYEKGKIDNGLILHEQAHCKQNHSIDIILIEILKVLFWFNPIIWIIKKEIQLNHEYLADNKVLRTQNLKNYQNILLNLVFRNNSTYLASNFNYSLTKKRLIMMTKNNSLVTTIVRRIAIVPMVLILSICLTFGQSEKKPEENESATNIEWMKPFLNKHGFNLDKANFNFLIKSDKVIDNSYTNVKVAFNQADTALHIIESPIAEIDKEKSSFRFENGKDFTYSKNGDYAYGSFEIVTIK